MVPTPSLAVRPATVADAEAVSDLVHSAYRSEESRRGWTTEADLVGGRRADAAMIRHVVGLADAVVLLAEDDAGAPFACCHLERREDAAYLGMFAVRPTAQGRGVGRGMLDAAEAFARDRWRATSLQITVLNHRPELQAWYERCGFTLTGERYDFPYDDERFGVPRRPDLALLGMVRPVRPASARTA
ncbi:GNAT family N-acetyltransferase [Cellulomonas aerilata]|uniref:N-acetyltransferase n=1 Tax=Cellulomonas aerilata TaxID=515326 RepID=A0A512D850_9CELL|nr:GNAT family N-acetyltransferase [Cellulomonas aerilata]GEO32656.1 N-acetyltransferase [Cellulomonas aerilata]